MFSQNLMTTALKIHHSLSAIFKKAKHPHRLYSINICILRVESRNDAAGCISRRPVGTNARTFPSSPSQQADLRTFNTHSSRPKILPLLQLLLCIYGTRHHSCLLRIIIFYIEMWLKVLPPRTQTIKCRDNRQRQHRS